MSLPTLKLHQSTPFTTKILTPFIQYKLNMQFNTLLSAMAVMVAATGVAADCSPSHPIGDKCPSTSEGALFCDNSCSNIVSFNMAFLSLLELRTNMIKDYLPRRSYQAEQRVWQGLLQI